MTIKAGDMTEMRFNGFLKRNPYTFKRVKVNISVDRIMDAALQFMPHKVNAYLRNKEESISDLLQKDPAYLLDVFFNTDYIVSVDKQLIAIDVSCKTDAASISKKEKSMSRSMIFLRGLGIKKALIISWNNPTEDSLYDILDAIESEEEVATVVI